MGSRLRSLGDSNDIQYLTLVVAISSGKEGRDGTGVWWKHRLAKGADRVTARHHIINISFH